MERSRSLGVYPTFCRLRSGAFLLLLEEAFREWSVLITVLCCLFLAVVNSNRLFFPFSCCLFLPPFPMSFLNLFNRSVYLFSFIFPAFCFSFLSHPILVSPLACLCSMLLVFMFARSLSPFFVLQISAAVQPGPRAQPCGLWDCREHPSRCQHPCHCD